jgi:hypothetical protein
MKFLLALPPLAAIAGAVETHPHRRISVAPGKSIADEIHAAHARGNNLPHFSLLAEVAGTEAGYEVHVREGNSAVTSSTTAGIGGDKGRSVNADDVDTILVHDDDDDDIDGEAGAYAMIAVSKISGRANGIVQKGGRNVKFTQNGRGKKVRGTLSFPCRDDLCAMCLVLSSVIY